MSTVVDLHNHTKLCKHAVGEMSEYIERAIGAGVGIFGFSDHAPMEFDQTYRMALEEAPLYEERVRGLRELYRGEIEILLGYEVDFLPGLMEEQILKADVDYLIGSVHFLPQHVDGSSQLWGFDNPEFIGHYEKVDRDRLWEEYLYIVSQMVESGLFQIVGHIDLLKVFNFKPSGDLSLLTHELLERIEKSGMAVEINSAGLRKPVGEQYPSRELLEEIFKRGIPITFGSDAHEPDHVGYRQEYLRNLAREIGFREQAIFRRKEMELIPL
ncbi:MAG: histidinol-phosphatase HisJ family protein [Epsilonproteobacteria bacterium]|nr:histidinol phosphate phosphatase [Campylobacterota bacterium]NPA56295.1 histidinol-phosphatase HisJ family protein [Campylobacterota bacterium]